MKRGFAAAARFSFSIPSWESRCALRTDCMWVLSSAGRDLDESLQKESRGCAAVRCLPKLLPSFVRLPEVKVVEEIGAPQTSLPRRANRLGAKPMVLGWLTARRTNDH